MVRTLAFKPWLVRNGEDRNKFAFAVDSKVIIILEPTMEIAFISIKIL